MTFRETENQIIGIDHAELGGMVAKSWNFSSKMVEIIGREALDLLEREWLDLVFDGLQHA
jgi:HD-like signal output (HDOD) protein